jgi:hypothetical protein
MTFYMRLHTDGLGFNILAGHYVDAWCSVTGQRELYVQPRSMWRLTPQGLKEKHLRNKPATRAFNGKLHQVRHVAEAKERFSAFRTFTDLAATCEKMPYRWAFFESRAEFENKRKAQANEYRAAAEKALKGELKPGEVVPTWARGPHTVIYDEATDIDEKKLRELFASDDLLPESDALRDLVKKVQKNFEDRPFYNPPYRHPFYVGVDLGRPAGDHSAFVVMQPRRQGKKIIVEAKVRMYQKPTLCARAFEEAIGMSLAERVETLPRHGASEEPDYRNDMLAFVEKAGFKVEPWQRDALLKLFPKKPVHKSDCALHADPIYIQE